MRLNNIRIGFALTGSHCTVEETIPQIERLVQEGAEVFPIISDSFKTTDTRFGKAEAWINKLKEITGKELITTITDAEPIGPKKLLDVIVIAPCTGNTVAKLANGITDGAILMAVKAHLRNLRPVVIGISTNDGLGINAKNLGLLINLKNIFMVPFGQDNPIGKPNSLKADMHLVLESIEAALQGRQYQPVIISFPS